MEAIRNYLETMFAALPNTPDVLKAKHELGQMMEDKYTELKEEGKTENEAIGTVIAEFGNLDELSSVLGIRSYVKKETPIMENILSFEEVKEFLNASYRRAVMVALGVMLCILSPITDIAVDITNFRYEKISVCLILLIISIAVGLFIYSGQMMHKWDYLRAKHYILDYSTTEYVHAMQENYRSSHILLLTAGIVLCIMCAIPAILLENAPIIEEFSVIFVIATSAVGVFMIILTCMKNASFDRLLSLNHAGTIGGNYAAPKREDAPFENPIVNAIMSVYWPTVTCIYLIYSFVTFHWWASWIIWPIAAVLNTLIRNLFPTHKDY